jgi:predicted nuclease with TOPRIM domain
MKTFPDKGAYIMAERKPRATREDSLNAKLAKNAEAKAKLQEKMDTLDAIEADLKQKLAELKDEKKKAERAAEAKAKREEKKKAEKELMKAISKSGLSMEEIKKKLGI